MTSERVKTWKLRERSARQPVKISLSADSIPQLLLLARRERDALDKSLLPARPSERAIAISGHWTARAIPALQRANAKRQVQVYVRAANKLIDDAEAEETERIFETEGSPE